MTGLTCGDCSRLLAPTALELDHWSRIMRRYREPPPCPGACFRNFVRADDPRFLETSVHAETPACGLYVPKRGKAMANPTQAALAI